MLCFKVIFCGHLKENTNISLGGSSQFKRGHKDCLEYTASSQAIQRRLGVDKIFGIRGFSTFGKARWDITIEK
jgi:hypothetical protein